MMKMLSPTYIDEKVKTGAKWGSRVGAALGLVLSAYGGFQIGQDLADHQAVLGLGAALGLSIPLVIGCYSAGKAFGTVAGFISHPIIEMGKNGYNHLTKSSGENNSHGDLF